MGKVGGAGVGLLAGGGADGAVELALAKGVDAAGGFLGAVLQVFVVLGGSHLQRLAWESVCPRRGIGRDE